MQGTPNVLTIAGSDSSGGAGIQADIKTFTALKVYGASVITALTAQNTLGVHSIFRVPPSVIEEQLVAVLSDIEIDTIKIGMLYTKEAINIVSKLLSTYKNIKVVIDPVLISSSGTPLLEKSAQEALTSELFRLATVITPNIPETDHLLGQIDKSYLSESIESKAEILSKHFECSTLVKGGHGQGHTLTDVLYTNHKWASFSHDKIETKNTHGTGCTLSSATAAYLAKGYDITGAVEAACNFTNKTISASSHLNVGKNYGPVNQLVY